MLWKKPRIAAWPVSMVREEEATLLSVDMRCLLWKTPFSFCLSPPIPFATVPTLVWLIASPETQRLSLLYCQCDYRQSQLLSILAIATHATVGIYKASLGGVFHLAQHSLSTNPITSSSSTAVSRLVTTMTRCKKNNAFSATMRALVQKNETKTEPTQAAKMKQTKKSKTATKAKAPNQSTRP